VPGVPLPPAPIPLVPPRLCSVVVSVVELGLADVPPVRVAVSQPVAMTAASDKLSKVTGRRVGLKGMDDSSRSKARNCALATGQSAYPADGWALARFAVRHCGARHLRLFASRFAYAGEGRPRSLHWHACA
jgi:hypothetical protein